MGGAERSTASTARLCSTSEPPAEPLTRPAGTGMALRALLEQHRHLARDKTHTAQQRREDGSASAPARHPCRFPRTHRYAELKGFPKASQPALQRHSQQRGRGRLRRDPSRLPGSHGAPRSPAPTAPTPRCRPSAASARPPARPSVPGHPRPPARPARGCRRSPPPGRPQRLGGGTHLSSSIVRQRGGLSAPGPAWLRAAAPAPGPLPLGGCGALRPRRAPPQRLPPQPAPPSASSQPPPPHCLLPPRARRSSPGNSGSGGGLLLRPAPGSGLPRLGARCVRVEGLPRAASRAVNGGLARVGGDTHQKGPPAEPTETRGSYVGSPPVTESSSVAALWQRSSPARQQKSNTSPQNCSFLPSFLQQERLHSSGAAQSSFSCAADNPDDGLCSGGPLTKPAAHQVQRCILFCYLEAIEVGGVKTRKRLLHYLRIHQMFLCSRKRYGDVSVISIARSRCLSQ